MQEKNHMAYSKYVEKYKQKLRYEDGSYKNSVVFGETLENPIRAKSCLLLFENDPEAFSGYHGGVLRILKSLKEMGYVSFDIIAKAGWQAEPDSDYNIRYKTKADLTALISSYELIISDCLIPGCFIKREGQTVLLLLTDLTILKQFDRVKIASKILPRLLNTSGIVVYDDSDREYLIQKMQLMNIYQGAVINVSSEDSIKTIVDRVRDDKYRLNVDCGKKKLLIFLRWDDDYEAREKVLSFCDKADYDKWDITVITNQKKMNNRPYSQILNKLNTNTRIICRSSGDIGSVEEICDLHFFLSRLLVLDDYTDISVDLHKQIIFRLYQRMLGDAQFDTFWYFGSYNNYWTLFAFYLSAHKKVLFKDAFDLKEDDPIKKSAIAHLDDKIFDEIILPTKRGKEKFIEQFLEMKRKTRDCYIPIPATRPEDVKYDNEKTYLKCEQVFYYNCYNIAARQIGVLLLPMIKGKLSYVYYSDVSDPSLIETWVESIKEQTVLIKVISDPKQAYSSDVNQDSKMSLYSFCTDDIRRLSEYMSNVSAYLTTDRDDATKWRIAADLAGKEVLLISEKNTDVERLPRLVTWETYNTYRENIIKALL